LVGLAPQTNLQAPQIESKTLQIGGMLVNFIMPSSPPHKRKPPAELQSPPIENFLATVLPTDLAAKQLKWQHCQTVSISVRHFFEDRQCSLLHH